MRIADVLRAKGTMVATVTPGSLVAGVLELMAEHQVGAVVVVGEGLPGGGVAGMVWERDVIRHLHERGAELLGTPVSEIMTAEVVSCTPADEADDVMRTMTVRRIRHLPVIVDDRLGGIVSLGDLVKARIDELEVERAHLRSYIAT